MQKQIRQKRTDSAPLRRPCGARHNATVPPLLRRLQPALDVEQHPRAIRVMADSLEQQLPIDAVEETFDVEIEHPVVAPAALTSCTHGIKCRSAGPVTIGISVERRLQVRLQETTSDFQRDPLPSVCPTGASRHSPLESQPAAPAEESRSLRTTDSKVCRGCSKDQPRTR